MKIRNKFFHILRIFLIFFWIYFSVINSFCSYANWELTLKSRIHTESLEYGSNIEYIFNPNTINLDDVTLEIWLITPSTQNEIIYPSESALILLKSSAGKIGYEKTQTTMQYTQNFFTSNNAMKEVVYGNSGTWFHVMRFASNNLSTSFYDNGLLVKKLNYTKRLSPINSIEIRKMGKVSFVNIYYKNILIFWEWFIINSQLDKPTNLKQEVQSPYMDKEEIFTWAKIWKFQSGSGVILSADMNDFIFDWYKKELEIEIYKAWEETLIFNTSSTGWKLMIPFQSIWAWDYYWRARVKDTSGITSDWVDYWNNNSIESDFSFYEWFEPYPYGYNFVNSSPANWIFNSILDWWVSHDYSWNRIKVDWNKWDIFNSTFDLSSFEWNENKLIDAFIFYWLDNTDAFQWWNCYGMAVSAALQKTHSWFIQKNFPIFESQIWNSNIWEKVEKQPTVYQDWQRKWSTYNEVIKTILSMQLSQYSKHHIDNELVLTPKEIFNILKSDSKWIYILNFWWTSRNMFFINKTQWHTVVPYRIESDNTWDKIFFWDNNYPYSESNNKSYEQYIKINLDWTWEAPSYSTWNSYWKMSLIHIDDIYNFWKKSAPKAFSDWVTAYTLSWTSDIYIEDNFWNKTGYYNWEILNEIEGINSWLSRNTILEENIINNKKIIYVPNAITWITLKVNWVINEKYSLMVAWWDYFTLVEWVNTTSKEIDTYNLTNSWVMIDFDNSKIGDYNLLTDNFTETQTGTIFLSWITIIPESQKYSFNWNKVKTNTIDSITYQIDSDNDGNYDITSTLSALPNPLDLKWSISWYVKWNTNATMAWWKICLDTNMNWTCEENIERFINTDNLWYYKFDNLEKGNYSIIEIPHQNWNIAKNSYNIVLNNWQNIIDLNFENIITKWKTK